MFQTDRSILLLRNPNLLEARDVLQPRPNPRPCVLHSKKIDRYFLLISVYPRLAHKFHWRERGAEEIFFSQFNRRILGLYEYAKVEIRARNQLGSSSSHITEGHSILCLYKLMIQTVVCFYLHLLLLTITYCG